MWANLPFRIKGILVVSIPLVALLVVAAVFLVSSRQQQDQQELTAVSIRHSMEVNAEARVALGELLSADAAIRAYLLSKRDEFLEPSRAAQRTLPASLARLEVLVKDNPGYRERLARLKPLVAQLLEIPSRLRQKAAIPGVARANPVEELLAKSQRATKAAREELDAIENQQDRLLAQAASPGTQSRKSEAMVFTGVLVGLLGGILSVLLFTTSIVIRLQRIQQNAKRVEQSLPILPSGAEADEIGALARRWEMAACAMADKLRETAERVGKDNSELSKAELSMAVSKAVSNVESRLAAEVAAKGEAERALSEAARVHAAERKRLEESARETQVKLQTAARNDMNRLEGALHSELTGRQLAEQALEAAREEARRAGQAMETVREEARLLNESRTTLFSGLSQALRTPLHAMLTATQQIDAARLRPRQRDNIDEIVKACRRSARLVSEALDLTAAETGRLALSPEPVLPLDALQEAGSVLEPLVESRGIKLKAEIGEDWQRPLLADAQRFRQVLRHLLTNAVEYNRAGGVVTVSCAATADGYLRLKISDTGAGIAPEKLALLFRPFEPNGSECAGIGLAWSKRLVELMGGRIGVDSVSGQGSTFWVELPLVVVPSEPKPESARDLTALAGAVQAGQVPQTLEQGVS